MGPTGLRAMARAGRRLAASRPFGRGAVVAATVALLLTGAPLVARGMPPAQGDGGAAKNVIVFLGDGMSVAQRTAGRLATVGAYGRLAMDALPYAGVMATNSVDPETFVTDSAAAASAMATGVKTVNGAIDVDPSGQAVTSIAELAKAAGKAVGVVTTSQVTDASGAAFGGAHVADRADQSEIARQMIEEVGVDVILGGGEDRWLPDGTAGAYPDNPPADPDEQSGGDRGDLIARAQELGYVYVSDAAGLEAATGPKLLGLFANEEMFQQAPEGQGDAYDPVVGLEAMTAKAIEILSQDPDGFFLFVEEEAIDEMAGDNNGALMIEGVQALDQAVSLGVDFAAANPDTLVVVLGDHECCGLMVEALDDPEEPDESGPGGTYAGGAGGPVASPTGEADAAAISGEDGPFPVANSGYAFVLDWTTPHHAGMPVPVTAQGPGGEALVGSYENTHVFEALVAAMGLALPEGLPATPVPGIAADGAAPEATPVG